MNFGKICRTCLTLNGPLLSIYDGTNTDSCCLADMLSELIVSKPHLYDNMPQQVCLTCISEINRCYAFRNKCLNSDKTLRQLLPNTVNPSPPPSTLEVSPVNHNVQSIEVGIQTEFAVHTTQAVDSLITQDSNEPNDCSTQTDVGYLIVKQETSLDKKSLKVDQHQNQLQQCQNDQFDSSCKIERHQENSKEAATLSLMNGSSKSLPRSNTIQVICFESNNCKFNFDKLKNSQTGKEQESYVLMDEMRTLPNSTNDTMEIEEYLTEDEQEEGAVEAIDVAAASSHFGYYDDENDEDHETVQTNTNVSHNDDVSTHSSNTTAHEIVIATPYTEGNSNATTAKLNNCGYSLHSNEVSEEMKVVERTEHQNDNSINSHCNTNSIIANDYTNTNNSTNRLCSRKQEYKCPHCIMTFVSLKNLRRHLFKRHNIGSSSAEMILEKQILEKPVVVVDFNHADKDNSRTYQINGSSLRKSTIPPVSLKNVVKPQLVSRERIRSPTNVNADLTKLKYFCELCNAGFAQRKTLLFHMKQNICSSNNFKCWMCDRIFITQENLDAHVRTHTSQHTCVECARLFENVEDLSQHMITEHKRNARNQCRVCKKVFTMKTSLIDHMRIHSGEKPFPCTVCGKSFRQNSNLRQHLMRHTNEKNFKCDICSTAYVTKAELFSHKRTHTGDHPFKCDICETRFTSSSSLQKHCRKHTGERPYACEFCPMRFTALNVLKNHRRTHTGEKPFKCDYCGKTFTQKGDCQMHQRAHTDRNLRCFCGATFTKYSNLRHHTRKHHKTNENNGDDVINHLHFTVMKNEEDLEGSEELLIVHDNNVDEDGDGGDTHDHGDIEGNLLISEQHTDEDDLVEIALEHMC